MARPRTQARGRAARGTMVRSKDRATSSVAARRAMLKRLRDEEIEHVLFWVTDLEGHLKSFAVTPAEMEGALDDGMGFDGSSITGFNAIEESDMVAIPDPDTFQVMPRPIDDHGHEIGAKVARVICDVVKPDGTADLRDVKVERRANGHTETFYMRPDGVRVVTVVDGHGRMVRRYRHYHDGREVNIIDNRRFRRGAPVIAGGELVRLYEQGALVGDPKGALRERQVGVSIDLHGTGAAWVEDDGIVAGSAADHQGGLAWVGRVELQDATEVRGHYERRRHAVPLDRRQCLGSIEVRPVRELDPD